MPLAYYANVLCAVCNCRASDTATDQHVAPRKANIRPIASQQPHIRSVQPVRSSATETRAMASIRPMAASVLSSVSSVSTPMATVMPTTAAVSDSKSLPAFIHCVSDVRSGSNLNGQLIAASCVPKIVKIW